MKIKGKYEFENKFTIAISLLSLLLLIVSLFQHYSQFIYIKRSISYPLAILPMSVLFICCVFANIMPEKNRLLLRINQIIWTLYLCVFFFRFRLGSLDSLWIVFGDCFGIKDSYLFIIKIMIIVFSAIGIWFLFLNKFWFTVYSSIMFLLYAFALIQAFCSMDYFNPSLFFICHCLYFLSVIVWNQIEVSKPKRYYRKRNLV